jgi:hypothetical protein
MLYGTEESQYWQDGSRGERLSTYHAVQIESSGECKAEHSKGDSSPVEIIQLKRIPNKQREGRVIEINANINKGKLWDYQGIAGIR